MELHCIRFQFDTLIESHLLATTIYIYTSSYYLYCTHILYLYYIYILA